MAEFTIYQSEFAVRAENTRLKAELEAERSENARLRALAGEPARVVKAAPVRPPAVGETFKSGNCSVSIAPAAGSPALAAAVIAARGQARAAAATEPAQAVAQAPQAASDDAATRFAMLELDGQPQAEAQSFQTGNCKVTIGAPPPGLPAMNPAIAAARARRAGGKPGISQPIDIPQATKANDAARAQEVDSDDASVRFSQMELGR